MAHHRQKIKPKINHLRKKRNILKMPVFWIVLGIFILVIGVGYGLFFYEKFQIKRIEITGNVKVDMEDIKNIVLTSVEKKIFSVGIINLSSRSIFVASKHAIIENILSEFSDIKKVSVNKDMPDTLRLQITERQPFAIFCQNKDCFFIDDIGVIFNLEENNLAGMVVFRSQSSKEIELGGPAVDKNILDIFSKVQRNLKDNFDLDVKEVLVGNPLIFTTSENFDIYFDSEKDVDLQITKMNALLKNEIPENDRKNLQYIYLQYKDRAYYK